jgi:hypothetical protein
VILGKLPDELVEIFNSGNSSYFDALATEILTSDSATTEFKWASNQGLWAFNTDSYYDWLPQLGNFTVMQELVNNVTAYPFVAKGEDDGTIEGQEDTLVGYYNNAGIHNATYHLFETNLGAGLHCQIGAEPYLSEVVYDWLDGMYKLQWLQ